MSERLRIGETVHYQRRNCLKEFRLLSSSLTTATYSNSVKGLGSPIHSLLSTSRCHPLVRARLIERCLSRKYQESSSCVFLEVSQLSVAGNPSKAGCPVASLQLAGRVLD